MAGDDEIQSVELVIPVSSIKAELRNAARDCFMRRARACAERRIRLGWSHVELANKMGGEHPLNIARFEQHGAVPGSDYLWVDTLVQALSGELPEPVFLDPLPRE